MSRAVYLLVFSLFTAALSDAAAQSAGDWRPLFNGKDLSGWDILTYPHKQEETYDVEDFGIGKDPLNVFSVNEQGELAITGQVYGAVTTVDEHRDYHLRCQVRWGQKKWPPRTKRLRDSGLLYHGRLPHQVFWKVWMGSLEYQVQETDLGDYFRITIPSIETRPGPGRRYVGDAPRKKLNAHLKASFEPDAPHGEWNTCEIITRGNDAVHIANGFVVFRLWNAVSTREGPHDPKPAMDEGLIQIQSEGAEVYYRGIEIRSLDTQAISGQVPAFKAEASHEQINGTGPENGVTITYTHQGDTPADIVAIELYGQDCRDYFAEKPQYPLVLAPGESTSFKVYLKDDAKKPSSQIKVRVETLAGPAEQSVEIQASK